MSRSKYAKIEKAIRLVLEAIGEDPEREGLRDTPRRVAKMYLDELTIGINKDPEDELSATFNEGHSEMVIVKDIQFYSLCEHHLIPYAGKVHIGYIPNGTIIGISKLARLVKIITKTLSVQERVTSQIADSIMKVLVPQGVMVVVQAEHLCMSMRGVQVPGTKTVTSAVRGVFLDEMETRTEFLKLIER